MIQFLPNLMKRSLRCSALSSACLVLLLTTGCSMLGNNNSAQPAPSSSSATPSPTPTTTATPAKPSESTPIPTPTSRPTPSNGNEVDQLLDGMTLEQKVGQMILAGIEGTKIDDSARQMIKEQHIGGVILYKDNISNLGGSIRLINELKQANKDNPAPLFISVDQEGGKVSRLPKEFVAFPSHAIVGETGKPELAEEMGSLLARQLKSMGFNVNFAPVLDINSNPNNPVIGSRSFGNSADLVTKLGLAEIKGMQEGQLAAVAKHYPGHGDTSVDSHLDLPIVQKTTEQLKELEWVPFKAAVEAEVDAVMVAHILFPRIDPDAPSSFSKIMIEDQLRGQLGYQGVVITDDMTMGAISKNYGIEEASIRSVEAGSDILLIAHGYTTAQNVYNKLLQSVRSGDISESRINESVRRILTLKQKYNMTDDHVPVPSTLKAINDDIHAWIKQVEE